MRHNAVTIAVTKLLEELDIDVSMLEIRKDARDWCKNIARSINAYQIPNWNLL